METFSALLAICAGNLPVTGELPSQSPVTRSFDIYLRCQRAHYDVIVMDDSDNNQLPSWGLFYQQRFAKIKFNSGHG